ncbi:Peptidoglycan binding-like [uncultured Caudovirales phage]|uniref:Peptidoglycan binding-like n=1 Tax=uncultured Caudovirales phage TaxID=2100421 RepID=A0A6J5NCD5_9CAUD|nr:Peptidoglycan binding-like [uncultured Caudovirales phage]
MARKYTGWDKDATGKRKGTEKLVQLLCAHFNGAVSNNGTWVVRPSRGSGRPSVHGTGRAADISWRRLSSGKGYGNYKAALEVLDFLVAYSEVLFIEELHDYFLAPHGRGWKCDRMAWKVYDKPTIGTQGGDWWHLEIANDHADDPAYYEQVFAGIKAGTIQPNSAAPAAAPAAPAPASGGLSFAYPGKAVKVGSKGDAVKLVQAIVGVKADGNFGPQTATAVKAWQTSKNVAPADGIVGKQTWSVMFGA